MKCISSILFTGFKTDVEEFLTLIQSDKSSFDFDKLLPMPETVKDTPAWQLENWGSSKPLRVKTKKTKKDSKNPIYHQEVVLETPKSFPSHIFKTLALRFPEAITSINIDQEDGKAFGTILLSKGKYTEYLEEGFRSDGPFNKVQKIDKNVYQESHQESKNDEIPLYKKLALECKIEENSRVLIPDEPLKFFVRLILQDSDLMRSGYTSGLFDGTGNVDYLSVKKYYERVQEEAKNILEVSGMLDIYSKFGLDIEYVEKNKPQRKM